MSDVFSLLIQYVLRHEGGYVCNPADPGGETKFGICKREYPDIDIRNLTVAQACEIYKRDYYVKSGADRMPAGLALMALDGAVNQGVPRTVEWVQRILGAKRDGVFGPATAAALTATVLTQTEMIEALCAYRARAYWLVPEPLWNNFGNGWRKRLVDVRKTALALVADPFGLERKP